MDNIMLTELQAMRDLVSGRQREYFEAMISGAKCVTCTPLAQVFSKDEIRLIGSFVRKKECYKNAHLMTLYFPDVDYVEGEIQMDCGLGKDHAFNRRGDQYFDATWELALGNSVEGIPYLSIGEYTSQTITEVTLETGYYGDIFRNIYIKNHNNHGKESNNQ